MGVEYNQLGEECESIKASQGRKFEWVGTTILERGVLGAWGASREIERELGVGATMEVEF
jgi:hypothetical protein